MAARSEGSEVFSIECLKEEKYKCQISGKGLQITCATISRLRGSSSIRDSRNIWRILAELISHSPNMAKERRSKQYEF